MAINKRYGHKIKHRDRTVYEGSAKKIVIHAETGRIRAKVRYQGKVIKKHKIAKGDSKTIYPYGGVGGPVRVEVKLINGNKRGTVIMEIDEVSPQPINPGNPGHPGNGFDIIEF